MYYIGIDIGGTTVKAGVVTEKGQIVHKVIAPTIKGDADCFVRGIANLLGDLFKETNLEPEAIYGIGVGCAGIIDLEDGIVVDAGNLQLWNFPLKARLEEILSIPVLVNNDANCAALGEYYTLKEANVDSFVMITLGTGIGGGIILNKKIYTGCDGSAGEFGCMVMPMGHLETSNESKRYWEDYASASALVKAAREAAVKHPDSVLNTLIEQNDGNVNGKLFFGALAQGDKVAENVFKEYIKWLGDGLISILYTFRPEIIVIGGGLSHADQLWEPLKKYLAENSDWLLREKRTEIHRAVLGNDAGIIGASLLHQI